MGLGRKRLGLKLPNDASFEREQWMVRETMMSKLQELRASSGGGLLVQRGVSCERILHCSIHSAEMFSTSVDR